MNISENCINDLSKIIQYKEECNEIEHLLKNIDIGSKSSFISEATKIIVNELQRTLNEKKELIDSLSPMSKINFDDKESIKLYKLIELLGQNCTVDYMIKNEIVDMVKTKVFDQIVNNNSNKEYTKIYVDKLQKSLNEKKDLTEVVKNAIDNDERFYILANINLM